MFISRFEVNNFRSLMDVEINGMKPVCIFHGLNNSGKSNILAAIDAIMRGKYILHKTVVDHDSEKSAGSRTATTPTSCLRGRLDGFHDNFHMNDRQHPIRYKLSITFDNHELDQYRSLLERVGPEMKGGTLSLNDGHPKILNLCGTLKHVNEQTCEAETARVDFNGRYLLYTQSDDGPPVFIPSLKDSDKVDFAPRVELFESLIGQVTDAFLLIGADRFLGKEKPSLQVDAGLDLQPGQFKQSLFRLATDKELYTKFTSINKRFTYADISFFIDRVSQELEIMVEQNGLRLPLSRIGSGLQQILFLVANVVFNEKKILGIEELEMNLSPQAQKEIFEMVKKLVFSKPKVLHQALVTSHSPYFQNRNDVRYYEVSYDSESHRTAVSPGAKNKMRQFFKLPVPARGVPRK